MIVHVRDFGKIASADIDLSELVVFVGENNSGKTYMMQLIYGLFSFFRDSDNLESDELVQLFCSLKDQKGDIIISAGNTGFYKAFQDELNHLIERKKEELVESVFHTKSLSIGSLWLEFDPLPDQFSFVKEGGVKSNRGSFSEYRIRKNDSMLFGIGLAASLDQEYIDKITQQHLTAILLSELCGFSGRSLNFIDKDPQFIYLPASRSGIMLLYANYLSDDKTSEELSRENYIIKQSNPDSSENKYGLSEPIYRFLMFLLQYKYSEKSAEKNKKLISFIDNNIINGRLKKQGNEMRYYPERSKESIPIALSSSLVSEIAPIYQVLSGIQRFSFILYDEIETCQHPTKQLQLARLLIRMVNAGYRMIVSTHSDTMAAAINNLLTLSCKKSSGELASQLGYEKADLLQKRCVKAYQFIVNESGKTIVSEITGYFSIGVGFDFELFNRANDKIYQDAVKLAEVE